MSTEKIAEELLPSHDPVQLIDHDGQIVENDLYTLPPDDQLLEAYGRLVAGRRFNDQAHALVRQGRLAVYPSSHGQEACQVGCAQVLSEGDWLFPTYRDSVAIVNKGVDPVDVLTLLRGTWHSGYDPYANNVAPQATPLATQLLHAVGVAHAARLKGEDTVVMALTGDGATSEGDFHEALNFAAVFKAPVVFFIQNNGYAISVPLAKQSAAPSLAYKGVGYGIPSQRVDGNDMGSVLACLNRAVERARAGVGPHLVEAHTYRMGAHTNADDATRYRDEDEVQEWIAKDPITRLRKYLLAKGLLTDELQEQYKQEAETMAAHMRDGLNAEQTLDPQDMFAHVYAKPTPQLREQSTVLADELEREGAH